MWSRAYQENSQGKNSQLTRVNADTWEGMDRDLVIDVGDVDSAADDLVAPCHGSAAVDPSLDGVARGRRMAPALAFFCSS